MQTTIGQLLVNEALPEDLRDHNRVLDKKGLKGLLRDVAEKHPDRYAEVTHNLMNVGQSVSTTGNFSFSLKDFQPPAAKHQVANMLRAKSQIIIDDPKLDNKTRSDKLVALLGEHLHTLPDKVLDDSYKSGSRLAEVVKSGGKGSPTQFNTTVGAPLLYMDHKDNPVPIPVLNSISEGLDPAEYWASAYGARKSMMTTKMAVAEAGYFGKKLGLAANRLVVSEHDCGTTNGIMMDGAHKENVGTILQKDIGGLKAGTVIRPEHLPQLKGQTVLIRSPLTCQAGHGLCARCAGVRERGTLPAIGDNLGVTAASALGERLSQTMLSSKHNAGAATAKKNYAYEDIERLFEMPKSAVEFAPVAESDGVVKGIRKAPTGGVYLSVGNDEYWAPDEESVRVKPGQHIEAGEVLTSGIPNPTLLAKHRGIGDARRMFVDHVQEVTGGTVSRRNSEVLARAMIAHVSVNHINGPGGTMIGDNPRYDDITRDYEPRAGSQTVMPTQAKGHYLEQPVMHYTIGTKVNDRVIKDLQANGVKNIVAHKDPPAFEPDVQRMFSHSQLDSDWMTRMSGYHLGTSVPDAVHRGLSSEEHGTSYVPSLAKGVEFGIQVKQTGKY
jgi:DNA-directed RNA polymerase subunit beta'